MPINIIRNDITKVKCDAIVNAANPKLIASGSLGVPKDEALQIAISQVSKFLLPHEMLVYIVVYDQESFHVSKRLIEDITEYIDEYYVEADYSEEGADRAVNYHADHVGTQTIYETVSETVRMMRANEPIAANWSKKIDEDFQKRKKKK